MFSPIRYEIGKASQIPFQGEEVLIHFCWMSVIKWMPNFALVPFLHDQVSFDFHWLILMLDSPAFLQSHLIMDGMQSFLC